MTVRKTFERAFRFLVPAWLTEGHGDAVLRSLTRQIDENVDRFREGLNARFPTRAVNTSGALELIGQDRGLIRGRAETAAHYAARLVAWRYPRGHRVRGSAFALLNQVSEYWGGVACQTIDANETLHERDEDGNERFEYGHSWTWDVVAGWSRFWIVVDGSSFADEHPDLGDPDLWGGALGTSGYTIGQTGVQFEDVQAIRRLLTGRAWRPAGTQPEWLVLTIDPLLSLGIRTFDETFEETFGDPQIVPDASWAHWSKQNGSGVQVATRDPRCRYWSLDPEHNNTYAGDPDLYCVAMTMPGGGTYAGDPDTYPASLTLYDGSTYAGNPASFPAALRLPDDGDPIP